MFNLPTIDERELAIDVACETLYRFLGAALSVPRAHNIEVLRDPESQRIALAAAEFLQTEFADAAMPLGFGECPIDDLDVGATLRELPPSDTDLRDDYIRVFGFSMCRECPPYETEYCSVDEPFYRSQQLADIAGFYSAFGLEASPTRRERADHIATELEFAALLLMKKRLADSSTTRERVISNGWHALRLCEGRGPDDSPRPSMTQGVPPADIEFDSQAANEAIDVCQSARASFFRDHLSWWAPSFSLALRHKAEQGFYAEAARLLGAFLPLERTRLKITSPKMPLEARAEEPEEANEACAACTACA